MRISVTPGWAAPASVWPNGTPRIFNTEQGSRFTSESFTAAVRSRRRSVAPGGGQTRRGKSLKELEHLLDGSPPQAPCRPASVYHR